MKKLYFLLIGFCLFGSLNAQLIDIPDANFKKKLLEASADSYIATNGDGKGIKIDSNNDNEIQRDEALAVQGLRLDGAGISNFDGLEYFTNIRILEFSWNKVTSFDASKFTFLKELNCFGNELNNLNLNSLQNLETLNCYANKLETLDLSGLSTLKFLDCNNNSITQLVFVDNPNIGYINCSVNPIKSLDVSGHTKLVSLLCTMNDLSAIDVSNCTKLSELDCSSNKITTLDLSSCHNLFQFNCNFNLLESLFIKNNFTTNYNYYISFNPTLKYICVDEDELLDIQSKVNNLLYTNCVVNSYCSFTPGGIFYTIKGKSKLDIDNNGCTVNDAVYKSLKFKITIGTNTGNFISDTSGNYSMPVQGGTHTITPIIENPNYFNISPTSLNVAFPAQTSPYSQDFCVTPNGIHNDLEVVILPLIPARPGFDTTYKIIYKNKGNTSQSGSVSLTFNDAVLDYVSATPVFDNQITNKLSWDYMNLQPFETREITVTLNVNSPMQTPAVNNGDRLSFNALITPVTGDEKPVDNSFALRQIVVGSFDPNDKTCLEGDVITPELIGEYVHYLIRFENTGSYAAENIVVKDLIDLSKFDISTLVPTKASHEFVTKISDGNKVEFIFENINLPFDDATNDGYITFKIKTLPTLATGDSFANEANIYFDYNFPIITNKATSTFKTLAIADFEFLDYFSVYPNPVTDILNIETRKTIELKSISIYDMLGQIVIGVPNAQNISKVGVSKLSTGNYFLKINTDKGSSSFKFIKH
ncbi:T9SS type A sorting domain-containing protein [Flavobacterium frigoris]|nr:T9SS type A sorting domain-containing protein [Flavobacterium frigoris]